MEKLKFTFQIKPTSDEKSNFTAITSITTQDDKAFLIPEEHQSILLHKHILASKTYIMMKNTLKKRYQTRNVWIKVTNDILQTYVDEDGNMMFQDQFLEETTQEQLTARKEYLEDQTVKILEKLVENQQKNEKQSIKKLAERFVIGKYDGKNLNAYQWMEVFEKEYIYIIHITYCTQVTKYLIFMFFRLNR